MVNSLDFFYFSFISLYSSSEAIDLGDTKDESLIRLPTKLKLSCAQTLRFFTHLIQMRINGVKLRCLSPFE